MTDEMKSERPGRAARLFGRRKPTATSATRVLQARQNWPTGIRMWNRKLERGSER